MVRDSFEGLDVILTDCALGLPFVFFAIVIAYGIGSIPFGLVLSSIFGYGDIRKIGSGNIGATNVLRTGNKWLALFTLALDTLKGAVAIIIWNNYNTGPCFSNTAYWIAFFVILGHCYPIWLKFKGGKGVATTLGTLLAAAPFAGLAACVTWLVIAFVFKISSLAALVAVAIAPVVTFFLYGSTPAMVAFLITILVWWRHKDNIKRLLRGEEPKINFSKKKSDEPTQPAA